MKNKEVRICLTVGLFIFALYLAIQFWPVAMGFLGEIFAASLPLLIGAGTAYVIAIPMDFFRRIWFPKSKKKWVNRSRNAVCMVLAVLSVSAIIALVIGLVLPQLIECIKLIVDLFPASFDRLLSLLERYHLLSDEIIDVLKEIDWKSRLGEILGVVSTGVSGVVGIVISTVTGLISGTVTAVLSIIFALYLLMYRDRMKIQLHRAARAYFPSKIYGKLLRLLTVMDQSFHRYIVGQCLEALILGVLCAVGMLILRLPYEAMISALIAFTALIPVAGAYIGAAVGAFMILTVSPFKALVFVIFLFLLQQVEGNLIYPKVVGTSLGLPGLWVLAAVTVGGGIMGIPGMLLGVPLAATVYRLLSADVARREEAFLPPTPPVKETVAETEEREEKGNEEEKAP